MPPAPAASQLPADDAPPPSTPEDLGGRARHLLEAIAGDDPRLASDILFPRDGWIATRDVEDAGQEWDHKVAAAFRRAVHGLSRRHGNLASAQFVALDIGPSVVQVTPKRRGWKAALWTVHGSRVTFVVDGRTKTLSVREMTSWRGHWYVTHLR